MKTFRASVIYLGLGILILALSACAALEDMVPDVGPTPEPESALVTTSWSLVSYGDPGSETPVIEGTEVTLEFQDESQAVGLGGCNSFGTQYEVVNDQLTFVELISTQIACAEEGVMEQEQAYYDALRSATEFERTDSELQIWYDDGQSVLNFEQADG